MVVSAFSQAVGSKEPVYAACSGVPVYVPTLPLALTPLQLVRTWGVHLKAAEGCHADATLRTVVKRTLPPQATLVSLSLCREG